MRNFLVWNGVNSSSLSGLIICELPPITKPAMRTQVIEIDGKDGDITDALGYKAYDKTVKIGFYGDYNINQIIKFFTGSGEIVFSNEPDKFYNAEITEQIDFERLVFFKTASVKFHVQPYKYLVGEPAVTLEITDETGLTLTNQGLKISKPIITLTGSGIVEIAINNIGTFQVNIDDGYLTVNSEIEECYKDNLKTLKNRQMIGQFPILQPSENVITWSGNLAKIEIYSRSRWL